MWFTGDNLEPHVGHIDVAGKVRRWRTPRRLGNADGIAVGPDGTAHLAFGRCVLGRLAPGKALELSGTPIPARQLAFDPNGGL